MHSTLGTRIVQLRASHPAAPLSLDRILERLAKYESWDPLPSRGSVQNVVRDWEELPLEIRQRDMPFQWFDLQIARLSWEASEWVLRCQHFHQIVLERYAAAMEASGSSLDDIVVRLGVWETFTNRWATWCWRVYQAAPSLVESRVLSIALEYSQVEQLQDLVPDAPLVDISGWDAFLRWAPWRAPNWASLYAAAIGHGIISRVPDAEGIFSTTLALNRLPPSSEYTPLNAWGRAVGIRQWISGTVSQLVQEWEEQHEGG